jgi:predicted tellurium resistance membrane protein TerC
VFLLAFVGAKMLLAKVFHIPAGASLGIIVSILAVGVIASLIHSMREDKRAANVETSFSDDQAADEAAPKH